MVGVNVETDSKVSDSVTVNHKGVEVVIHFYKNHNTLQSGIYVKTEHSMKCIANIHKDGKLEVKE